MRYQTVEVNGRPQVAVETEAGLRATRGGHHHTLSDVLALPSVERDEALQPGRGVHVTRAGAHHCVPR